MDYNIKFNYTYSPPIRDVTEEVNAALIPAVADAVITNTSTLGFIGPERIIYEVRDLLHFKSIVDHSAEWDIKRPDPWRNTIGTIFPGQKTIVIYEGMLITPEQLGNYTYGALGRSYGYKLPVLYAGSYYAADFPLGGKALYNEVCSDWLYITLGYFGIKAK